MAQEYGAVDLTNLQANSLPGKNESVPNRSVTSQSTPPRSSAQLAAQQAAAQQAATAAIAAQMGADQGPDAEGKIPGAWIIDADEASFDSVVATSLQVPVVLDLWAPWCGPCKQLGPVLAELAEEYQGRFQLVKINVDENPAVAQAFQAQSIPMVIAMIGGRPAPMFQGAAAKAQIKEMLEAVLNMAAQMGISGILNGDGAVPEPVLSPEEQEIEDLKNAGDLAGAKAKAEKLLLNNPQEAQKYQQLVDELSFAQRLFADSNSATDTADPLSQADQLFALGQFDSAFQVLLEAIANSSGEERDPFRERLLELFRLCADSEAVKAARVKLTRLLF